MGIVAYIMEYCGAEITSPLKLRNYTDKDFEDYKCIYENCFFDMRTELGLSPVNCCDTQEELLQKHDKIFLLEVANTLIGSVAIYGNEIDDLIVSKKFQGKGYGKALLQFAVSRMQELGVSPVFLRVAEWNQGAVQMYLKNGFVIMRTETF